MIIMVFIKLKSMNTIYPKVIQQSLTYKSLYIFYSQISKYILLLNKKRETISI
jgi:hypothetical protein